MQRTFAEQLGNIGSELGRAAHWDELSRLEYRNQSLERTLELIDAVLLNEVGQGRLRELTLFRELVADHLAPNRLYGCSISDLQQYCMPFAIFSRTTETATPA